MTTGLSHTTYLGAVIGAASGALVGPAVIMAATRAEILGSNVEKFETETESSGRMDT